MPNTKELLKEEVKKLDSLSTKSIILTKNYLSNPTDAPTMDFPIAKKMWAHIDVVNEAFKNCFKEELLIPEKEEEFIKTVLPEVEYMNSKWSKWKDIEEYRGQVRDMAGKFKSLDLVI